MLTNLRLACKGCWLLILSPGGVFCGAGDFDGAVCCRFRGLGGIVENNEVNGGNKGPEV